MSAKCQKILVVEDDVKTVATLKLYLEHGGFETAVAVNGKQALEKLGADSFALMVLDLNLPEIDGLEVCRQVRRRSNLPIIILTAKTTEEDKLRGLELGADDYVAKPFSPRELTARVRAVLRRTLSAHETEATEIRFKDLTINLQSHEVRVSGKLAQLTPTEFNLLETFLTLPKRTFTRRELVERTLGWDYEGFERTIDAHIRNLRKKIDLDPEQPSHVTTVFGVGYRLVSEEHDR
jgi:DNA-binding response OmpR family regulator